ncbi:DUF29 domain-containing protein [Brevundimonas sp. R86498]|uniref:DUF29 domain-containing protein n=1 Tax=Brevundimonas sp. R86498 TaxID=3093845 RepID=UPI0037C9D2E4
MADDLTPPANDLYARDYVAWTEAQAAALRARGAGPTALDHDTLAGEIEDLGKSEVYACQSMVERIIEHLLKLQFVASPQDHAHWRGELVNFRGQLEDRLSRTIQNRLLARRQTLFLRQLKALSRRELIADADRVMSELPDGYSWDQIVDPDWYPVPSGRG